MVKLRAILWGFVDGQPWSTPRLSKRPSTSDFFFLMPQRLDVNPISEHSLYLRLYVSNSGGV